MPEFDVIVNVSKPKCLIYIGCAEAVHHCRSPTIPFITCENVTEMVNAWPYLGHIICKDGDDKLDIVDSASLVRLIILFAGLVSLIVLQKLDCRKHTFSSFLRE